MRRLPLLGLLAALVPAAHAADPDTSATVDRIYEAGRREQARIDAIPVERRVLMPGIRACVSADAMIEVMLAVTRHDLAHMMSVPGCFSVERAVRVAVLGYPTPITAELRVIAPTDLGLPTIYALPTTIRDSANTPAEPPAPTQKPRRRQ